jgi:hypothetical protein
MKGEVMEKKEGEGKSSEGKKGIGGSEREGVICKYAVKRKEEKEKAVRGRRRLNGREAM